MSPRTNELTEPSVAILLTPTTQFLFSQRAITTVLVAANLIPFLTGLWFGLRRPRVSWTQAIPVGLWIGAAQTASVAVLLVLGINPAREAELNGLSLLVPTAVALLILLAMLAVASSLLLLSGKATGEWLRRQRADQDEPSSARIAAERVLGPPRPGSEEDLQRIERFAKLIAAIGPLLTFSAAVFGSLLTFAAALMAGAKR
jgi:hypothetical protein